MQPDKASILTYQKILLNWWSNNARDYPWRHDCTPYRIAVAELMLRRTQADQVVNVYNRFLAMYPTLEDAADADDTTIKQILYSLGLSWRAQNMIDFFHEAFTRFGNDLPLDYKKLCSLPGIGDYVGAAIVCFAGKQIEPLIDTNVVRVLGRIFGLRTDGEARRRMEMRKLASTTVFLSSPDSYHFAILDFAARVCLSRHPQCKICPFSNEGLCEYFSNLNEASIP